MPGTEDIYLDTDSDQITPLIDGQPQPFRNLSAGQLIMLALVADLAIRCVTQNNFLLPADALPTGSELPEVLEKTPGVVLIDELDVHLHPKWQRRVARDLKETFLSIQFVCTSHSPQVIGEVKAEEMRLLRGDEAVRPAKQTNPRNDEDGMKFSLCRFRQAEDRAASSSIAGAGEGTG